ncbi:hypothetical protein CJ231_08060 [Hoylesella buccalis]|uniref:Uncharacterized protein n=1 Tax=Hoylesella buccalis TaxID=28127 RepID=A0A2N6QQ13_9BACT|nr:hypothetical protein CJ231_08060 [Hoylesella buccalis]
MQNFFTPRTFATKKIQKYEKTKVPYSIYGYTPLHYRSALFKKRTVRFFYEQNRTSFTINPLPSLCKL